MADLLAQAVAHGNPTLLLRAGLFTAQEIIFALPSHPSLRHVGVLYSLLKMSPISYFFHPQTTEHFLHTHNHPFYGHTVDSYFRRIIKEGRCHSRSLQCPSILLDPQSIPLNTLVDSIVSNTMLSEDEEMDIIAFTDHILEGRDPTFPWTHVLPNDDSVLDHGITLRTNETDIITIGTDTVGGFITCVVDTDDITILRNVNVVLRGRTLVPHTHTKNDLLRRIVPGMLVRWLRLDQQAPLYLAALVKVYGPWLQFIKYNNGFHSFTAEQVALLNKFIPEILPASWPTLPPLTRGLFSLTHSALCQFMCCDAISAINHYHPQYYQKALQETERTLNISAIEHFDKVCTILCREKKDTGANTEDSLGDRVNAFSDRDRILLHNVTGTHYHIFTRAEYPTLLQSKKNFYTAEAVDPHVLKFLQRQIEDSVAEYWLPSRPWLSNMQALSQGEWILRADEDLEALLWEPLFPTLKVPSKPPSPVHTLYSAMDDMSQPPTDEETSPELLDRWGEHWSELAYHEGFQNSCIHPFTTIQVVHQTPQ